MKLLENTLKINELYESVVNAIQTNKFNTLRGNLTLIKDIEKNFEINYSKRKKEGVFYTQKEISDFIKNYIFS